MQFYWSFPQFIVDPVSGGLPNVVTAINWVCTGTDGYITASNSGTVQLSSPNPAEYIPYDQITQAMAYQWVSQSISTEGVEMGIAKQIELMSAPQAQPQNPPF